MTLFHVHCNRCTLLFNMPVPPPKKAKRVHEGPLADIYQWEQEMFDGSKRTFECFVRADTAGVLAFLDKDTLLMTKQTQPGRGRKELFFDPPGGMIDPGETPKQGAARELTEETGYAARKMKLWSKSTFDGMVRFEEFVFLAKDLKKTPEHNPEHAGEKIELIEMPWKQAVELSLTHQMRRRDIMLAILAMEFDPKQKARLKTFLQS